MNPIQGTQPIHPRFATGTRRNLTFGRFWPIVFPVESHSLIMAGLFYSGRSDWVVCFSCGSGFKNLCADDNIFNIHLISAPHCEYLHKIHPFDNLNDRLKSINIMCNKGKTFIPKHKDFVLECNSMFRSQVQVMEDQLALLKSKYKSRLNEAMESMLTLNNNIRQLKIKNSQLKFHSEANQSQVSNYNKRLQCPICYIKEIDTVTNCGHAYCESCCLRLTTCGKCRSIIIRRTRLYL